LIPDFVEERLLTSISVAVISDELTNIASKISNISEWIKQLGYFSSDIPPSVTTSIFHQNIGIYT